MDDQTCPQCGAPEVGGVEGCGALYQQFAFAALEDVRIAAVSTTAFEAYCMQPVETFCVSAKSYAAHLTRLCCTMEYGGDAAVYDAIQYWLNGKVELQKPPLLTQHGSICNHPCDGTEIPTRTRGESAGMGDAGVEDVCQPARTGTRVDCDGDGSRQVAIMGITRVRLDVW